MNPKSFLKGKNTIIRTKQQPTELKMILLTTNPIHETMYLKYIKNKTKKTKQSILKWGTF